MTTRPITQERIGARPYSRREDFMAVRRFLLDIYALYGFYHNWEVVRWEGQSYGPEAPAVEDWSQHVRIWETQAGQIVGVANREGPNPGNAWLQIHPDYRQLEDEMLDWGEQHLSARTDDGHARLSVEVFEYDTQRQQMLMRRGYQQQPGWGSLRWRTLDTPIPDVTIPAGYTVRSMRRGDGSHAAGWAVLSMAVFAHVQSSQAYEERVQAAPSYNHDLYMVCEAPDGTFAAFAGLTLEEVHRTVILEPVGTHPDHRRLRLAQAVIAEGLRRVKALNATTVYVGTGDSAAANRLYESMGFMSCHKCHSWAKVF